MNSAPKPGSYVTDIALDRVVFVLGRIARDGTIRVENLESGHVYSLDAKLARCERCDGSGEVLAGYERQGRYCDPQPVFVECPECQFEHARER